MRAYGHFYENATVCIADKNECVNALCGLTTISTVPPQNPRKLVGSRGVFFTVIV